MSNHNRIVIIRIVASTLLGLMALGGGAALASRGIEVPAMWWVVAVLAVGGVVGAEVVSAVMRRKNGGAP
ncbi:unnamed protein product [marine sediment metagenome]|uniref:Uncharacterized protein n=1 Tax=marine sediment metagenome TaxID=412755 RepID=X1QMA3_9ZZZZ